MPTLQPRLLVVGDEDPHGPHGLFACVAAALPDATLHGATPDTAPHTLQNHAVDAVLCRWRHRHRTDSIRIIADLRRAAPHVPVLAVATPQSACGAAADAVAALRAGAADFLCKPLKGHVLLAAIEQALESTLESPDGLDVADAAPAPKPAPDPSPGPSPGPSQNLAAASSSTIQPDSQPDIPPDPLGTGLVGTSPAMQRLVERIRAVAASDFTVLITGQSGTGKELVARSIHAASSRAHMPMLSVNCPAIPDELLESELFGHVKGSFSGATRNRKGLFVEARGSTLLLDEIGDISPAIQTKLLRALENKEVRPVGANTSEEIDVRILASTNQNLEARIEAGTFREDLYYRLNVLTVSPPPLDDRREDIPLLASRFLTANGHGHGESPPTITPEALAHLASRHWRGNVRELQNFMRRVAVHASMYDGPDQAVTLSTVRAVERAETTGAPPLMEATMPYTEAKAQLVEEFTLRYVGELLQATRGNVSEAARRAGLERVSLQKIIKRVGMDPARYRA